MQLDESIKEQMLRLGDDLVEITAFTEVRVAKINYQILNSEDAVRSLARVSTFTVSDGHDPGEDSYDDYLRKLSLSRGYHSLERNMMAIFWSMVKGEAKRIKREAEGT